MNKLDHILEKFKDTGLKMTEARKVILKTMIDYAGPFDADDIFSKISKHGVDRVTIYRTIQTLTDLELLNTIFISPGVSHYEFEINQEQHHHHVICKKCKKIKPVHICITPTQENKIKKLGFTNISHKLEFYGVCSSCS